LQAALKADVSAARHFDALSYTHKRELVSWVTSAKRAETRRRRLVQALEMLRRRRG